jgi:hypothetical protein
MAAVKVGTSNGGVTLLNPQPSAARMLDLLCAEEMFSIRRLAGAPHPTPARTVADDRKERITQSVRITKIYFPERAGSHARHRLPASAAESLP